MTTQPQTSTFDPAGASVASKTETAAIAVAQAAPVLRPLDTSGTRKSSFPIHALGVRGSAAVSAIQNVIQAPAGLCAQSVLTAMSTVVSSWGEVETIYGSSSVFALFAFTVAQSGERKSSADKEALKGIRRREKALRREYAAALAAIEEQEDSKKSAPNPRSPEVLVGEPTFEGLLGVMARGQGFVCLANDDAAGFFKGHAMSRENKSKMISGLSQIFSGTAIKRPRAHQRDEYIEGVPLTMHLMFQPKYLSEIFGDEEMADQGILNRVLCCYPQSTMGSRLFKRPSDADKATIENFAEYSAGIIEELSLVRDLRVQQDNDEDDVRVLALDKDARDRLEKWHDHVETRLNSEFLAIRTYAGRCVEQANRIAAVITLFDDIAAEAVGLAAMENAIELMTFYLEEYRHLRTIAHAKEEIGNARVLGRWLVERVSAGGYFQPRAISQYGPNALRDLEARDAAMAVLLDHGWIVEENKKGGKSYKVHPAIGTVM